MGADARVDEVQPGSTPFVQDSIRRNASFALLAQMGTAVLTAALTLYLVRALGTEGYGVFALAVAVAGLLLLPSDLGITGSAARFIAERRDDRFAVARIIVISLRLKLLLGGAIAVALWALAAPIAAAYSIPSLMWPLRGAGIALFCQSIFLFMTTAFTALGRNAFNLRLYVAEGGFETTASIVFVAAGGGATGAAFGRAAGYGVGLVLAVLLVVRLLGRRALALRPRKEGETRQLVTYAGTMLVVSGAFQLFAQIDQILIGAFLSAGAVGVFSASLRLTTLLGYLGTAAGAGISPRLVRGAAEGPNIGAFLQGIRLLAIVQAAVTAVVVVWAKPIVGVVLGAGYGESARVMQVLGPYIYLLGFGSLVSLAANFLGEARRRIPVAISAAAVNVIIDVLLIPRIGVVAGAIGTSAAYALYAPGHLLIVRQVLGFSLRPIAFSVGRSLAAGACAGGVLALFGTSKLTLLDWTAGGAAGLVTFVAALLLTREVSARDLRFAVSFGRRLLAR